MKLECDKFRPSTHPTYGAEGCYGCEYANIDPDYLWCRNMYWCVVTPVPEMHEGAVCFSCDIKIRKGDVDVLMCESCKNLKRRECKIGKPIKYIVVRFDYGI